MPMDEENKVLEDMEGLMHKYWRDYEKRADLAAVVDELKAQINEVEKELELLRKIVPVTGLTANYGPSAGGTSGDKDRIVKAVIKHEKEIQQLERELQKLICKKTAISRRIRELNRNWRRIDRLLEQNLSKEEWEILRQSFSFRRSTWAISRLVNYSHMQVWRKRRETLLRIAELLDG